jgi:uncharacterized membrane protein
MHADPRVLAAIAVMAIATYLTRIAGLWLVSRVILRGRLRAALEAVPGAILAALVAPSAIATGVAESAAALLCIAIATRVPMMLAIVAGVATVAALRAAFG